MASNKDYRPQTCRKALVSDCDSGHCARAIAVATLWQVSVDGAVDANMSISSLDELPPTHVARRNFKNTAPHRWLSCFRRGFLVIKAAILNRLPLPKGGFFPEPWPSWHSFIPEPNVSLITLSTA